MRRARLPLTGWIATERRPPDGTVDLEQRVRLQAPVVEMSEAGARSLGDRYWFEVEAFTRRLVRIHRRADEIELRLLGRWPLLRLGEPEEAADGLAVVCRFPIRGGLLARVPGGSIAFTQTSEPDAELRSAILGFAPRLAARPGRPHFTGVLYEHLEKPLHVALSRRYFVRLIREAAA